MNTTVISAIGALFLAAALTTLTTLLWPANWVALFAAAAIALFLNGWLVARMAASPQPSQPARRERAPKSRPKRETQPAPIDSDLETGTVKWFNRNKGFGFIIRESGEEIFVHQRSINRIGEGNNRRRPTLRDGQKVTFTVSDHEKGLQAENVSPAEEE